MISIDMKMALFQLRASLATWQVNCHTWRHVRRNSSVWKTRPWVRPSGRGRGCLPSGEHHMHSCTVVFTYTRYFFIVDFCATRQRFRCSARTEWPWHSGIRAYVPASWSQQPEELLSRITSPYWEVRWLWGSRQVPRPFFKKKKIMYIKETHLNLSFLQLSHTLKRRSPEGRASSMRTWGWRTERTMRSCYLRRLRHYIKHPLRRRQ